MDSGAGNVIIKPLSGQLTHDTDSWGKMDPYCKVKIGAQTEKSKTCTDGGKFPSWTDSMSFRRDKEDLINVEVWDADVGKDDLIGQGAVALSTVFNGGNKYNGWVDLTYKGKSAGKVLIDVQYFPDKSKTTTTTTTSTSGTYQIPTMGMTMQMQPTMMQQIPTTSIYTQPTVYQQPIYTQPTVYQQQQPIYQQQTYQQQQPIYQQPIYQQPTQQQQVYQQPIYQQTTQQQQVYQQPTQQQQVYQQPTQQVYQQPTQQQVYQQPTQQQFTQQQQVYPTQQQQFGGYPQQKF